MFCSHLKDKVCTKEFQKVFQKQDVSVATTCSRGNIDAIFDQISDHNLLQATPLHDLICTQHMLTIALIATHFGLIVHVVFAERSATHSISRNQKRRRPNTCICSFVY